jgi:hypothetical protein
MQVTIEKSQEQASVLSIIAMMTQQLDPEYLIEVSNQLSEKSQRMDSMAVVVTRYNPDKSRLLESQAKALRSMVEYINALKKCDELRDSIRSNEAAREEIDSLFQTG